MLWKLRHCKSTAYSKPNITGIYALAHKLYYQSYAMKVKSIYFQSVVEIVNDGYAVEIQTEDVVMVAVFLFSPLYVYSGSRLLSKIKRATD